MSKPNRTAWLVYGGIAGAVVFSVLAVLMLAWAKYFVPDSVHMSWTEAPILLLLTVPSGFMLGGWIGYEIAPKTKLERVEFLKEGLFFLAVMGVSQFILHGLWDKPEAKDNFWVSVAWDVGPIILASCFWKLLSRRKRKAGS